MPSTLQSIAEPQTPGPLWRERSVAFFWLARVLSTMAAIILAVSVGWQLYNLTGNPFDLGLVGLIQFVPVIVLTLVAGHLADRYDRRRIIALCQATGAVAAGLLLLGTLQGWLGRESIFLIIAIVGSARTFESPTMHSLLPTLVVRERIQSATALSASAGQTATIVGPAIGGMLYAFSPALAFGVAALCYTIASLLISMVGKQQAAPRKNEPATLKSVLLGIHFVRHQPLLLGVLSLDLFAVLLGGATALLPIYARDILCTGPWGLGLLRSAPAVGALSMSVLLARFPLRDRVGAILFGVVGTYGFATVVFGLSHWLPLSLLALALLGSCDVVSVVIRQSLVQLRTPDEMRGRVNAVNAMFIGTSNQLGEFESGLLAALLGAVSSVVIGGVGTILVAGLWMWLFPDLRRVRTLHGQ